MAGRMDTIVLFMFCINIGFGMGVYLIPSAGSSLSQSTVNANSVGGIIQCTSTTVQVTNEQGASFPQQNTICSPDQPVTGGGAGSLSNLYFWGDWLWGIFKLMALYTTGFGLLQTVLNQFGAIGLIFIAPFETIYMFKLAQYVVGFISNRIALME